MSEWQGCVASLAGFERMTTARLSTLLAGRSAAEAFEVAIGARTPPPAIAAAFARDPELAAAWRRSGGRRDPASVHRGCLDAGIEVLVPGRPGYPPQLLDDPRRPAALFVRGDLDALDARRVGIVGTRNATQRGRATAARFGHELADLGIGVVSGLALGVDGAAHRGALAVEGARPIAVVGSGPDVPYPRAHAGLWEEVSARGLLLSEWPPGTPPDAYRFPLRNRILAALVEVLVVVESRERGGSLITAREAAERGVEVLAVPGPIEARSALGVNQLLRDGATPATETADIVMALGLDGRRAGVRRFDPRRRPTVQEEPVLDACRCAPRTVEQVAECCHLDLAEAAMALARLEHAGWLREIAGWFEAVDEWADLT